MNITKTILLTIGISLPIMAMQKPLKTTLNFEALINSFINTGDFNPRYPDRAYAKFVLLYSNPLIEKFTNDQYRKAHELIQAHCNKTSPVEVIQALLIKCKRDEEAFKTRKREEHKAVYSALEETADTISTAGILASTTHASQAQSASHAKETQWEQMVQKINTRNYEIATAKADFDEQQQKEAISDTNSNSTSRKKRKWSDTQSSFLHITPARKRQTRKSANIGTKKKAQVEKKAAAEIAQSPTHSTLSSSSQEQSASNDSSPKEKGEKSPKAKKKQLSGHYACTEKACCYYGYYTVSCIQHFFRNHAQSHSCCMELIKKDQKAIKQKDLCKHILEKHMKKVESV